MPNFRVVPISLLSIQPGIRFQTRRYASTPNLTTSANMVQVTSSPPAPITPTSSNSPKPFHVADRCTHTKLKVYVFPTLHNQCVFHSRFLLPYNNFEYTGLKLGYALRKWRYQVSDFFAAFWQGYGEWAHRVDGTGIHRTLWKWGSKLTTRRCADEYFLKTVPLRADEVWAT